MKNLFLVILMFLSFPASANYAINGQCFATASEALDSFVSDYPKQIVTSGSTSKQVSTWYSVSSASISGQNLTSVIRIDNTNQAAITVPISNCSTPTISTFDITQALAAFAFFFSGVVLIFIVSHGGGAVLSVLRPNRKRDF